MRATNVRHTNIFPSFHSFCFHFCCCFSKSPLWMLSPPAGRLPPSPEVSAQKNPVGKRKPGAWGAPAGLGTRRAEGLRPAHRPCFTGAPGDVLSLKLCHAGGGCDWAGSYSHTLAPLTMFGANKSFLGRSKVSVWASLWPRDVE